MKTRTSPLGLFLSILVALALTTTANADDFSNLVNTTLDSNSTYKASKPLASDSIEETTLKFLNAAAAAKNASENYVEMKGKTNSIYGDIEVDKVLTDLKSSLPTSPLAKAAYPGYIAPVELPVKITGVGDIALSKDMIVKCLPAHYTTQVEDTHQSGLIGVCYRNIVKNSITAVVLTEVYSSKYNEKSLFITKPAYIDPKKLNWILEHDYNVSKKDIIEANKKAKVYNINIVGVSENAKTGAKGLFD